MRKSLLFLVMWVTFSGNAYAKPGDFNLSEEKNIYDRIYNAVLTTNYGRCNLSDIYTKEPVIVAFIFTRCSGICNPFILRLVENMRQLKNERKAKILIVSFDPADKISDLERMASMFRIDNDPRWIVAVTPEIEELTSSVAFDPVWDTARQQFDHEALLVGVNEEGIITKKLVGIRGQNDISSLLKSIRNEFVLSYPLPRENMLFSCFTYNPATGEKKLSFGLLLLLLPAVFAGGVVSLLAFRNRINTRHS